MRAAAAAATVPAWRAAILPADEMIWSRWVWEQVCSLDRPRPLQKLKAQHKQLGKTLRYIIYLCAAVHEGSFDVYNKSAPSGVYNQGPVLE